VHAPPRRARRAVRGGVDQILVAHAGVLPLRVMLSLLVRQAEYSLARRACGRGWIHPISAQVRRDRRAVHRACVCAVSVRGSAPNRWVGHRSHSSLLMNARNGILERCAAALVRGPLRVVLFAAVLTLVRSPTASATTFTVGCSGTTGDVSSLI